MRADEADVDHAIRIVDPNHDAIFVAGDVEHDAAILEDTCAADSLFYIGRVRPVCSQDLPVPRHEWVARVRIAGASGEECLERAERDDPHDARLAWSQYGTKLFRCLRYWNVI